MRMEQQISNNNIKSGLEKVIFQFRNHSPNATIIFAYTTPSPLDSNSNFTTITPLVNRSLECKNYNKFHSKGFVSKLNDIAKNVSLQNDNVIINDRYSTIFPVLDKYQKPCDIHFIDKGYQLLAKHDWELFSKILFGINIK